MAVIIAVSYQDTLTDIEDSIGFVSGFMEAVSEDTLVHEWPVFEQYPLCESIIPPKYRELMELAVAATQKCPYCGAFHRGAAEFNAATEDDQYGPVRPRMVRKTPDCRCKRHEWRTTGYAL